MGQHDVAVTGVATNHHAIAPPHELFEIEVETEFLASAVAALEAQHALGSSRGGRAARGALRRAHMIDLEPAADVLGTVFAAVDEGPLDLKFGDIAQSA